MNYLSHGVAFLDRPLVLAGSVVPDLLSAIDRRCRVRQRRLDPILEDKSTESPVREVVEGLQAHLQDDHWFHGSEAFLEVSAKLTRLFRKAMPDDDTHRVGFLGHIVVELLLDRWIIEQNAQTLKQFYEAFAAVDPQIVQYTVNRAALRPTEKLIPFWHRFVEERFLADYVEPERMHRRLNHVMKRVGLPRLDDHLVDVLVEGHVLISDRAVDLLPARVVASVMN